jgi:hypothetical protein
MHDFDQAVADLLIQFGAIPCDEATESNAIQCIKCVRFGTHIATSGAAGALKAQASGLEIRDKWEDFWNSSYDGRYYNQAVAKRAEAAKASALDNLILTVNQSVADILGAVDSDFIVPVADQYDAAIGAGGVSLGGKPIDSVYKWRRTNSNHASCLFNPEIWGTEGYATVGFNKSKVGQSGAIRSYLQLLGISANDLQYDLSGERNTGNP